VDPADEFHSPYVYCHNDPVNFLDPDGAKEETASEYVEETYNNDNQYANLHTKTTLGTVFIMSKGARAEQLSIMVETLETGKSDTELRDFEETSNKYTYAASELTQLTIRTADATTKAAMGTSAKQPVSFIAKSFGKILDLVSNMIWPVIGPTPSSTPPKEKK